MSKSTQENDLTPLLSDIKAAFEKHGFKDVAYAIAFTLPPDYNYCHWITNVSREDSIRLFSDTAKEMIRQPKIGRG